MRILIIEDDKSLNRIITKHLQEAGYAVDCCFDGEDGLSYMESLQYDCIVLDWMLPKRDGLFVLHAYRNQGFSALVLMLTAKDSITGYVMRVENNET